MKFLPLDLCKKLKKLGCTTGEINFQWEKSPITDEFYVGFNMNKDSLSYILKMSDELGLPAFTLLDFVSNEEFARENCEKLVGASKTICIGCKRKIRAGTGEWVLVEETDAYMRCMDTYGGHKPSWYPSSFRHELIDGDWIKIIEEALNAND